jgi:hypothetical protein
LTFPFRLEPLSDEHERSLFRCGEDVLDRYFQTQVTQDIRRRVANCFVALENATSHIAAYYTISAASIRLADLPPNETKRLPRYPHMRTISTRDPFWINCPPSPRDTMPIGTFRENS